MTIQALEKAIENLEYKVAKLEFEVYEQRRTIGQLIMGKADRKTEPKTEKCDRPQMDCENCSVNGRPYDCEKCEYFRCTADEPQTDKLQFAKQCHKPSSLYYRCYCDERKEDEYCNGCRFWYESQTERSE